MGDSRSTSLGTSDFQRRVIFAVRRIPSGRVATYGDIAALAGKPRAARAVGNIMRTARVPGIPYHRVIGAGGAIGGFGGNVQMKRELLRAEGVDVGMGRIRGFEQLRWRPKSGSVGPRGSRGSRGSRTR